VLKYISRKEDMPRLTDFFGIKLRINWKDNDQHHLPHVHAYYGEYKADIALDGTLLAGDFPKKQLRLVRKWLAVFDEETQEAWDKAVEGIGFDELPGLEN
jgi:hypothetical protein